MAMRSVLILLVALVLGAMAVGCGETGTVADMPVEDDEEVVSPAGPESGQLQETAGQETPVGDDAISEGSVSGAPSSMVSSVRDVYAVLAPEVVDGYVFIDSSVLGAFEHIRFTVAAAGDSYEFFGYVLEGEFIVRAAACPCCGSDGLAHGGTSLVCHACGTTYGLATREASDECRFPVGEIPYMEDTDGVRMSVDDLVEAYQRTADGEEELFEPEPEPVENEADDTSWPRCCGR
jgi:hypothetical protein